LPFTKSGQDPGRVYSYNPGARMGSLTGLENEKFQKLVVAGVTVVTHDFKLS